ncbi:TPA: DegT/DnrJ/EryC1/StrS aminotransferase family protein [bacterium]|nr:DegT/DnrJ/EryC1/StrS aminotransferase family protein [bacterium]
MIPVFRPSVGEEELQAIREVLESGWLGLGPKTALFEEKFKEYIGVEYAIALNSCTAALHLALKVLGVGPGDEVLVPSLTFVSTIHAVLYNGAFPIFIDIEEETLLMSIEDAQRKITPKTKVILPVDYAGHPVDLNPLLNIAKEKGIYVVEDAAHACGAEYRGRKIGSISDLTCFSFHAVKNLTTGEGGMITTSNREIDSRLKKLRWVGINKDTWSRTLPSKRPTYAWQYDVEELGYKYHMSDIAAAIGLVQLKRLDEMNRRRHEIYEIYNQAFSGLNGIITPIERDYVQSAHHIYVLKVERRDELISHLKENDIAPGVHYFPCHLHTFYKKNFEVELPVTERIWEHLISVPIYPGLSEEEIERVIQGIRSFYEA